jgi:hypothetical protein
MNSRTTCLTLLVSFVCLAATVSTQSQDAASGMKHTVTSAGCVKAGVEAGCLVLSETKTKKTYNLFFADKKPDIDTAISFEGTVHHGPTTCMQGTPVDVTKWTNIRLQCPKTK